MQQVELTIDEKPVKANAGAKVLEAALAAEIYIPNLCYIPEAELPYGGCRLCYVHVEGRGLVTACTLPIQNGMKVHTQTPEVIRVRRTAYKLLIGYHNLDCRACWKNKKCDLQKLAAKVKVKLKRPEDFRGLPTEFLPLDTTNPYITYDPIQCIICGKCVWVCSQLHGEPLLDFAYRGNKTRLTLSQDASLVEEKCPSCGQCAAVCPTAALRPQGPLACDDRSAEGGLLNDI